MPQRISITEARTRLTRILHRVERGETVEITRWGDSIAVLLSVAEYRHLSGEPRSFWTELCAFRESLSEDDFKEIEFALADLREDSPGRDAPF